MKRALLVLVALAAVTIASCVDRYPEAFDDDLLSVRVVCPDGRPECPATANGASILGIEACTNAEDRRPGLKVVLRIAPLEWQNPPDLNQKSVFSANLSGNPCVTASFVTRTTPDLVRVDAEMMEYRTDPIWIQTIPADVSAIELLPQPAVLGNGVSTTVKLNTMVLTSSGKVTQGTRVYYEVVDIQPPTATAYVWPGSAIVDLTRNPPTAEATLVTGPSATDATVRMTAVPPDVEGATPGASMFRDFTLSQSQ